MSNAVQYTDVDLNADATTTIYDPDHDAKVYLVTMENPGSTAEFRLEVTDGSDTAIISRASGGSKLLLGDTFAIDGDSSLQINVTTVEGSAQTGTAAVSAGK